METLFANLVIVSFPIRKSAAQLWSSTIKMCILIHFVPIVNIGWASPENFMGVSLAVIPSGNVGFPMGWLRSFATYSDTIVIVEPVWKSATMEIELSFVGINMVDNAEWCWTEQMLGVDRGSKCLLFGARGNSGTCRGCPEMPWIGRGDNLPVQILLLLLQTSVSLVGSVLLLEVLGVMGLMTDLLLNHLLMV